jgi:oligopeptide transport system substrate-binding protein
MFYQNLILIGVVFLNLVACTAKGPSIQKDILRIGNGAEPRELDPTLSTGVPEHHIIQNLFEPLFGYDPKTAEPVPGVAESWKVSSDGKVYTFKIRKEAKWSNGEPLTAHDFVYSWRRLLKPETAAEYAYQGYYLVNGKAFNTGVIQDPSKIGVKAIDDHTLQATLVNPTPFFIRLCTHHSLMPVPQKVIEKHGIAWTRPENIVSNGAFLLSKWQTNKIITLKPNPHYWERAIVRLKEVHYYPIENLDTEEKMFRSGKLEVTNEIPQDKLPTWQKDKTGAYQSFPYLGTYTFWLNVRKKPLDNKLVRKALNLAIDRERIVKYVLKGGQIPGTFYTPPGTGGFFPKSRLPADLSRLEEAKKLLAEAGFPGGKGMPPIEILYNNHEGHKKIAEALQEMWKKNLGIDVTLFNQEWKVYLDMLQQRQFSLARQGWIADYDDPISFLDLFTSYSGNNRSGWKSAQYDALIDKTAKERDQKKRLTYFQEAEDLLMEELPFVPLYIYTRLYLKSPAVKGWYPNISDHHPLKYVSVEPAQ